MAGMGFDENRHGPGDSMVALCQDISRLAFVLW